MDWTEWWYLASVIAVIAGAGSVAKALYGYHRKPSNGLSVRWLLLGGFLGGTGLVSLLVRLVYLLTTD